MDLFRIKPLDKILAEAEETGEGTLKKTLGVTALTLLGVGAIIGRRRTYRVLRDQP